MTKKVIGVLVSGRGSNLQAIIDSMKAEQLPIQIGLVISDNPDAYALERAQAAGIAVCVIERRHFSSQQDFEQALSEKLIEHKVELVVLAGFMRLLGSDFIKNWRFKIMNIHPSLLPSFPGLHPQEQAIAYGVKVSGCTVHFVDEGMDTGPIILQQAVAIEDADNADTLAQKILQKEHEIYPKAIALWANDCLHIENRKVTIKQ